MSQDLITVYLDEEYGYRYWIWETGMTRDQLVQWWTSLETVKPYFYTPVGLPGELTQAYLAEGGWLKADDLDQEASEKQGDAIPRDPSLVIPYESLKTSWKAHLHTDDDSSLWVGDERWVHAGFVREGGD
jgi:hypothetical protein